MSRGARFFAFATLLGVVAACGESNPPAKRAEPAEPGVVLLRPAAFEPKRITVQRGETVTWRWREKVTHNIVGKGGVEKENADSGSYRHTFDREGTYDYKCTIHPTMSGTVVVK